MRTRSAISAAALAALLATATLAGCGGAGDGTAQRDAPSQSGEAVPSGSSSALPPDPPVRPSPTPSSDKNTGAEITITGQPTEGVEAGCVVMQSGATMYQLIGGDRQVLLSGRQVTVTGRPAPGLMSICQQGTPFQVTSVTAA